MRNFTIYFLSIILLLTSFTLMPSKEVKAEINIKKNPYIQAYYTENAISETKNSTSYSLFSESEELVDPVIEEKIILETLEYYYQEDIKVADLLYNITSDENIRDKVLSTERQDKIEIMNLIKDIYPTIEGDSEKELLYGYLDRYVIGPENTEENIQEFIDQITERDNDGEFSIASTSTYNGTGAGNWAYNNYNKYSTNYPRFTGSFGTDCTNFVSQAMHVGGGKPKAGNWTISKKNSTYWVINSAAELNYSWKLTDPSPWISVKTFRSYWNPKSKVHSFSTDYYRANHKSIYSRNILKGDVVILHKGVAGFVTTPTHLMIISAYDSYNKDFLLAGHSRERQAYQLLNAISAYSYVEILEIP
ncbi:amidase domain-containing protein [Neobacillus notoginsengisoli]|nr:amidase domain-containing protein [Neobacillus notoginsengisoli]